MEDYRLLIVEKVSEGNKEIRVEGFPRGPVVKNPPAMPETWV